MTAIASELPIVAVIATRNRPELLAHRSLPSLVEQDRSPDALILVDDSDPDQRIRACPVAQRLESRGIQITHLQSPGGVGAAAAWNLALREAERSFGECWIAILDDDDSWTPNHLRCCLTAAQDQGATGVLAGIEVTKGTSRFPQPLLGRIRVSDFLRGNPGWQGSNTFIRLHHLLDVGGFEESLPSTLDRDLAVRILLRGDVRWAFVPRHTVHYDIAVHRDALSLPGSEEKRRGLLGFYRRFELLMGDEDKREFWQRASRLFGITPPVAASRDRVASARAIVGAMARGELSILGLGAEGVVLTDRRVVFKLLDGWTEQPASDVELLVARIRKLSDRRANMTWLPPRMGLRRLNAVHLLTYDYEESTPYIGGLLDQVKRLFLDLRSLGLLNLGYRPNSFRVVRGDLRLVDIGCDLIPWRQSMARHNLQRAYLMARLGANSDLREQQESVRAGGGSPALAGFDEFARFLRVESST